MSFRIFIICLLILLIFLPSWSIGVRNERHRLRRVNRSATARRGRSSQCSRATPRRDPRDRPNFVLFFADDMGHGDLASYGHPTQERGPIDDILVKGGIRFTQAYVPEAMCTPSRAALLTGRYSVRFGVFSSPGKLRVFRPWARTGLPASEFTIAEVLKAVGYTTGMVGKWHLGINSARRDDGVHLPMNHGFDFVGHILPSTHSVKCDITGRFIDSPDVTKCFLYKRDQIVAQPYNHTYLTQTFVNDAVSFIEENADNPFFLYFAFAHVHAPLFASPQFAGKSRRGEYGDNINEMSWAVGEVINVLEARDLLQNTLVLFISDHGPKPEFCTHGGDAGFFKGYKSNTWEGGVRVPFVAYWPGQIKQRESDEIVSTLDIIRTFVDLANGTLPINRTYDGEVITDVLLNDAPSPHDVLYFYCKDRLMAVRSGPYKVHYYTHRVRSDDFFASKCSAGGEPIKNYFDCYNCYDTCVSRQDPPLIYNVEKDPAENYSLNATTDPVLAAFVDELQAKVTAHIQSQVPVEPLLDDEDTTKSITPCCNPDTNCTCNFGPVSGPYD